MINGEPRVWIADLKRLDGDGSGIIAMNQRVVAKLAHDEVVKKLRDEIVALRSALQPIAEAGEALDAREFDILYERWGPSGKKHRISMRHLKHAAATYGVTE